MSTELLVADDRVLVRADLRRTFDGSPGGLPVLMYSIEDSSGYVNCCRRPGANGYLVKGIDSTRLVMVVRAVNAGEHVWPDPAHGLRGARPVTLARSA